MSRGGKRYGAGRPPLPNPGDVCFRCGSLALPSGAGGPTPKRRYCSEKCRVALSRKPQPSRFCKTCRTGIPKGRSFCTPCASHRKYLRCECGSRMSRRASRCTKCEQEARSQEAVAGSRNTCKVCGKEYRRRRSSDGAIACSRACGAKYVGLKRTNFSRRSCKVFFPTCRACGRLFTSRRARASLCSPRCGQSTTLNLTCRHCGKGFVHVRNAWHWPSDFCSEECSAAARLATQRRARRARRQRGLDDRGRHRSRARRFGVAYEPVSSRRVMERDGWRCALCGKKIRRDAKAPHPLSASLDHIIPMSKGGPHSYANVQAAHFRCNSLKRDRSAGEQLLLIG
jgi:hypothetical protein